MPENIDFIRQSPSFIDPQSNFTLDISAMELDAEAVHRLQMTDPQSNTSRITQAHEEMRKIEAGAIKNPDENRKVTHFTDRQAYPESNEFNEVESFAEKIRENPNIDAVIINGIGGSALGPQLLQFAINGPYWNELPVKDRNGYPRIYFIDNTDPAGVSDIMAVAKPEETITINISKSGGTRETRNNITALEQAYTTRGIEFGDHAIAVTMPGSKLDKYATDNKWIKRFPMAESIGGRTSETNIVGHVPAACTGINFRQFIAGAVHMDGLTRNADIAQNPAYQLAASWYVAGNGRGDRNMVVVPYSDRLVLLGKYLQQLVMESLGKESDLDGQIVNQGLTVYGNKGGTDAHAYIQQLNDGPDDFFLTFIEPLRDSAQLPMDEWLTMGDYLHGFKEGLARALRSKKRKIIDIAIDELDAASLGMLIALYERAVAFYAELIQVNAFNQPGVEAYKKASTGINEINIKLQKWLATDKALQSGPWTAQNIAAEIDGKADAALIRGLLNKFTVNHRQFGDHQVIRKITSVETWAYQVVKASGNLEPGFPG